MSSIKQIIPILIVLFLGYLGFSLAIPLFPPLFLEPMHPLLPEETSQKMRAILLGILLGMYPLGQLIGAPLLGKLSDKYGRKPTILISLIVVIPAYLGSALSIIYASPTFLFIARFLSGLLEGNIVIAQASMADITENEQAKAKRFGWLVSLSSTAFFFGPLISGKLAYSQNIHWFNFDTPFWAAACLTIIGFLIVLLLFKETHLPDKQTKISIKAVCASLIDGLKYKRLRTIYSANLFVFLSIFFFLNFFSLYLVTSFQFSSDRLGQINAYFAIPYIITPAFFGRFVKWWSLKQTIFLSSLCLCFSYLFFLIPTSPKALWITLIPIGFFQSIGFAFPAIMLSRAVDKKSQGVALGMNQSILVFAETVTALFGGYIAAVGKTLPIYSGSLCCLIAASLLFSKNRQTLR